jgi:hypothetical protein
MTAADLRVFVNAKGVDVPNGASALDCVRAFNGDEADAVASGKRMITDSRGLPIDATTPAKAGSIYRTVTSRADRDD